jgi:hypothetical protein
MIELIQLQNRFMQDTLPRRLGAVASDLMRLSGLSKNNPVNQPLFRNVLNEVNFFTEWTAKDLDLGTQEKLLSLQRTIAHWDPAKLLPENQAKISEQAKQWSSKLLGLSGLSCEA